MSRDEIYRRQNLGNATGLGTRCGLLLVDFVEAFMNDELFGALHIREAAYATAPLLEAFRTAKLPIAHTRIVFADDGADCNVFSVKLPGLRALTEGAPMSQIIPDLQPRAGELLVRKTVPSAFFSTSLAAWLRHQSVDTVVVAGCTTSGCVRASVIDAMQWNFRTVVIEDCVGDRAIEPHEANLFDMNQKYADVMLRDRFIDLF